MEFNENFILGCSAIGAGLALIAMLLLFVKPLLP